VGGWADRTLSGRRWHCACVWPWGIWPRVLRWWGCCWHSLFAVVVHHRSGISVVWRVHTVVVSAPHTSGRHWGLGSPHVSLQVVACRRIGIVVMRCHCHDAAVVHVCQCSIARFCAILGHRPSLARTWGAQVVPLAHCAATCNRDRDRAVSGCGTRAPTQHCALLHDARVLPR
jgi:hypothetical protein